MKQTTKSEKTKLIKKLIRLGFTETRAKEFLDEIIATRAELYSVNRSSAVAFTTEFCLQDALSATTT